MTALNGASQTDSNALDILKDNTRTEKTHNPMGPGEVGEVSAGEPTTKVDPGRVRGS
jgi:hypothetical protein